MPFRDRAEAGRRLAQSLQVYQARTPIILALPRGGVPVAAEVARALKAPLDLVLARKIGVPHHPELAMGAVADGVDPEVVRNENVIAAAGVSEAVFASICEQELAEIRRRRRRYVGGRQHPDLKGCVVIVVDDGIATGATTRAALRSVCKQKPRELILAIPVAPSISLKDLRGEADRILCLENYENFGAVGFYYSDFRQVGDDEVRQTLAEQRPSDPARALQH
jgi:putative phosphoribosyl transferase